MFQPSVQPPSVWQPGWQVTNGICQSARSEAVVEKAESGIKVHSCAFTCFRSECWCWYLQKLRRYMLSAWPLTKGTRHNVRCRAHLILNRCLVEGLHACTSGTSPEHASPHTLTLSNVGPLPDKAGVSE